MNLKMLIPRDLSVVGTVHNRTMICADPSVVIGTAATLSHKTIPQFFRE